MAYYRTAAQKSGDFLRAKEWEAEVRGHLPEYVIDRSDSTNELDFWIPGAYLETKEKRQRLKEWWVPEGWDEADTFVLDELSLRKAAEKFPAAYFLIRDVPQDRLFLASIAEAISVERIRKMRVGKGKLVYNLMNFRQLASLDDIVPVVMDDLASVNWRVSECVGLLPVDQVR